MRTLGNISRIASLDCKHEFPNIGSRYSVNELVTKRREYVRFQTPPDRIGVTGRLANRPPIPPFAGYILKAILNFTLSRFGLPLFGVSIRLAFSHRIDASSQRLASCEVEFAGLDKIHKRIFAQRHELFFPTEAITPTPQLRSSGIDQEKQAITVIYLEWLSARLRSSNCGISQRHSSSRCTDLGSYPTFKGIVPQSVPQFKNGSRSTSPHLVGQKTSKLLAF